MPINNGLLLHTHWHLVHCFSSVAATATTTFAAANTQLGEKVMPFAMTHGFTVAFKFSAALLFVGAVVLFFFINVGTDSLVETEGVAVH